MKTVITAGPGGVCLHSRVQLLRKSLIPNACSPLPRGFCRFMRDVCCLPRAASHSFPRATADRVAQSGGHLTRKSGILGSIAGLATYFRFYFRFFKKGSCQLLAKI